MIYSFKKNNGRIEKVDDLSDAQWINIYPPFEHGFLESLSKKFNIPLEFFEDSLDIDERSRYERDEDVNFILINTPILNDDTRESEASYITIPVGIIFNDDLLFTISAKKNPTLEKFMANKVKNFNLDDQKLFILQLFEQNVYRFLECLKRLNLRRNLIEQELFDSSRNKELRQLLRIEKSLVYFVNSLSTNELLNMKMKRTNFLKVSNLELHNDLFEDIIIDNGQALEMSNVYTNILSGTMEAYASIVSNNMNIFIHRLTIITIILMVPTLVASFYGMNLTHLPFQESVWAFPSIILFSIVLGFGLIAWFKSRKKF